MLNVLCEYVAVLSLWKRHSRVYLCDSLIVLVLNGERYKTLCMYVNNGHFLTFKQVEEQLVNSASPKGGGGKGKKVVMLGSLMDS